jgi:peptide-O-fucosyltransferase
MTQLFSSQQCKSSETKHIPLPFDLCLPSFETIIKQIKQTLKESLTKDKIETIYMATDKDNETLWHIIHENVPNITLITPTITISSSGVVSKHKPPDLITDIQIMSYSNSFIGNCISSFSAFVSRLRIYNLNFNKTTQFFSQNKLYQNFNLIKDEL